MVGRKGAIVAVVFTLFWTSDRSVAVQIDHQGGYSIDDQVWKLDLEIDPRGEQYFVVRLPYPAYTWVGRWDRYETKSITIWLDCAVPGPFLHGFVHYNQGYSNQGVYVWVQYAPGPVTFRYRVRQSTELNLPGHDYALEHFTNNGWMVGSELVDVWAPIVWQSLAEAEQLPGDWHSRGYWRQPEQVVNWMKQHLVASEPDYDLRRASAVLESGCGDCDDWAHAACAMLIDAGIPAKVVAVGALDGPNGTRYRFPGTSPHGSLAYWDGYGWILIDPQQTSGFTFGSRVILGADRDASTLRIETYPPDLLQQFARGLTSCENGVASGFLWVQDQRCLSYPFWEILEHWERPQQGSYQGTEPVNNVIPMEPTGIGAPPPAAPSFMVNYPNPFNPATTFAFRLACGGRVRIDIFSVDGRFVANVVDAVMTAGEKRVEWKAEGIASGVYIARLQGPHVRGSRKIVILR